MSALIVGFLYLEKDVNVNPFINVVVLVITKT